MRYFHGTQHVQSQILTAVAFSQKLPDYTRKLRQNSTASNLLDKLSTKNKVVLKEKLGDGLHVLGATVNTKLSSLSYPDKMALQELLPLHSEKHVTIFKRIKMNGSVFHSTAYRRVQKRNSYTVKVDSGEETHYGQIKYYCKLGRNDGSVICAVMDTFKVLSHIRNEHTQLHIARVEPTYAVAAVYLHQIKLQCVNMEMDGKHFISDIPNVFESD